MAARAREWPVSVNDDRAAGSHDPAQELGNSMRNGARGDVTAPYRPSVDTIAWLHANRPRASGGCESTT